MPSASATIPVTTAASFLPQRDALLVNSASSSSSGRLSSNGTPGLAAARDRMSASETAPTINRSVGNRTEDGPPRPMKYASVARQRAGTLGQIRVLVRSRTSKEITPASAEIT